MIVDEDNTIFETSTSSDRSAVKKTRSINGSPASKKPRKTYATPIESVTDAAFSETEHEETFSGDRPDLSHLVAGVARMSNKLCNNKLLLAHKCSADLYKQFFPAQSVLHKMTSTEFKLVFDACHISTTLAYFKMPWVCQFKDIAVAGNYRYSHEISTSVLSYFIDRQANDTERDAVVDMLSFCFGRKTKPHINDNYFYKHWHKTLPRRVDDAIIQVVDNMPSEFLEILNNNNEWIQDLMSM